VLRLFIIFVDDRSVSSTTITRYEHELFMGACRHGQGGGGNCPLEMLKSFFAANVV